MKTIMWDYFCSMNPGAHARLFMRKLKLSKIVDPFLNSASLDPAAEHGTSDTQYEIGIFAKLIKDLFERLRSLRGGKTMLFSSHRFGNLTRHADVIL